MEINLFYMAEALTECAVIKADLSFGDNLFLVRHAYLKQNKKHTQQIM